MNEDTFKNKIKTILVKKKINDEKINIFISEFLEGVHTGWRLNIPVDKKLDNIPPEILALQEGEEDFNATLRDIQKCGREINLRAKTLFETTLMHTQTFKEDIKRYNTDLRDHLSLYYKELETLFEQGFFDKLTNDVSALETALSETLQNIPVPDMRKSVKKEDKYLLTRNVFCLSHCILGIKGSVTNSNTLFNKILYTCFQYSNEKGGEFASYIRPCFEDYSTIYNMAFTYKKHNRLDLYIDHVHKTSECEEILDVFNSDWYTWKRPSNFNLLSSR